MLKGIIRNMIIWKLTPFDTSIVLKVQFLNEISRWKKWFTTLKLFLRKDYNEIAEFSQARGMRLWLGLWWFDNLRIRSHGVCQGFQLKSIPWNCLAILVKSPFQNVRRNILQNLACTKHCKETNTILENHLNPIMLVFIGWPELSTLRWVPMCQDFRFFASLCTFRWNYLHFFVKIQSLFDLK